MTGKRVKLSDIAKELNVSVGLVSTVLSGKSKENRISDSLAGKVRKQAEEMGYQANQLARGLRTGKSGIIGLIVADIANPYFGKMARIVENEAFKMGYQVMFGSSDENPDKLNMLIDVFLSRRVDAMVIVPVHNSKEHLQALKNQPIPVVYIDRYCEGVDEDVFCADNFDGTFQLTNLLLGKGYKKIGAFVYDQSLSINRDRIRGYEAALSENSTYKNNSLVVNLDYHDLEKNIEPMLKSVLNEGCDAILFANNSIGIKCLKLLDEMDIHVPKDLGIVSFDNPEAFLLSKPGITCFEQPIEEICSKAVELIAEKLKNKRKPETSLRMFKGNLIKRNSC